MVGMCSISKQHDGTSQRRASARLSQLRLLGPFDAMTPSAVVITNELNIAASLTHSYSEVASDSLVAPQEERGE